MPPHRGDCRAWCSGRGCHADGPGNRASLSTNGSTLEADATIDGERIASNHSALPDDDVTTNRDGVVRDTPSHDEVAASRDGGASDHLAGGDDPIPNGDRGSLVEPGTEWVARERSPNAARRVRCQLGYLRDEPAEARMSTRRR